MTTFGVVAFLMVAGWQVGADGTKEVRTDTEVALSQAVSGSDSCQFCVVCKCTSITGRCKASGAGALCGGGENYQCQDNNGNC